MQPRSRASLEQADRRLIAERYQVLAALGKGGSAQVYRVRDLSTGSEIALKQLLASASAKLTSLFELEYQTLASLRHPRVVSVFEYGREPGGAFYTMELLDGEDLKECAPLPWREACSYLRDAAQALGLLHARKLVHRDVSPRNLWRTPDGRVKLIDFGALAPFGPVDHVMGTPPLVPPEAFHGQTLDQRSDLYALGAVAYYLLTGMHAFPARDLRDLPELWSRPPPLPSQCVELLARPDLESVPAEFDTLVLALLSPDALARPSSTAELIDRLEALLGTGRPSQRESAEVQLSNSAFVGRQRERRKIRRLLLLASEGRGQAALIESQAGGGRSRQLGECALAARIAPAIVLQIDAASCPDVYGVASALGLKLLDALPSIALTAAAPYAPILAHLSPRLRERLGVKPATDTSGELRVRLQAALRDWFLAVASQHTLAILIDGLESCDERSLAVLLALALARKQARLLLVCTALRDRRREPNPTERALVKQMRHMALSPLSSSETFDLLHSVFGSAEHLARLAGRLQRVSGGNPGHVLELCQLLVRRQVIDCCDGSWVLPQDVPDALLSASRDEALAARLEFLDTPARELGQLLSLHVGTMPLALCKAMASSVAEELYLQLAQLIDEEILMKSEDGVRFSHEQLRLLLLADLQPARRKLAQRALANYLLTLPEVGTLDTLRAGLHLLDSGEQRGADLIAQSALKLVIHEADKVGPALPAMEESLALMRAAGRPKHELVAMLAVLCTGGYYTDRQYAARYGDFTVRALQELLGLNLATKLRRFLGRRLGLFVALFVAAMRFRKHRDNPRVPSFKEAMLLLFNCIATLAGTSIICIDPKSAKRYADVIEPLTALGKSHIATFMHAFSSTLADTVRDSYSRVHPRWQKLIARLESKEEIKGMPPLLRTRYLGGALYASGVMESQRDDKSALATAARLDALGMQLYQLSAHQVRTVYYANQGDLKRFEHHRAEAEQLAIQQGTIWQVETWSPSASITSFLRTHDAMGMKHASEQLARLSQEVASLDPYARRSRGTYLLLRKRYAEALPWLEECLNDEVRQSVGWGRAHGTLARAYNRLAEYAKARDVCTRVLSELDDADLAFPALNLILQSELLIAEAGLGRGEHAKHELAALIAKHEPNLGPLTLGSLHDAGVEIAMLTRDTETAKLHLAQMQHWYLGTGVPSLAQRCQVLASRFNSTQRATRSPSGTGEHALLSELQSANSSYAQLTVDRMLAGGGMSLSERAHKALQILAENTRCAQGFLFLLDDAAEPELVASLKGEQPDPAVLRWLEERVARELEEEMTQMLDEGEESRGDTNLFEHNERRYRVLLLIASSASTGGVLGAAVLGSAENYPDPCPADVLGSISHHLQRALQKSRSAESVSS